MPKISLHIDKQTLEQVRRAAEAERQSISKWIGNHLEKSFKSESVRQSDFGRLFGSVHDMDYNIYPATGDDSPDKNS